MARNQKNKIPTWLIVFGFFIGFWPGGILLAIRMVQEMDERDNGKARRTDREWEQNAQAASRRQTTYNAQGQRTYQPPKTAETDAEYARRMAEKHREAEAKTQAYGQKADGTYRYSYTKPQQTAKARTTATGRPAEPKKAAAPKSAKRQSSLLDHRKLSARIGKGLRTAGNIVLGCGALFAALAFFAELSYGLEWLWDAVMQATIVALTFCTPGAVMSFIGNKKHNRVMRCRTYATIIGEQRAVDINQLAAAIPTRYNKCVEDLNWMLGEGLLKGMYIDAGRGLLTYPDARYVPAGAEEPKAEPVKAETPAETNAAGDKVYPEETRIRSLNNMISDAYVSERMDRLEELTHKILAYAEAHPEKESSLRQFRNHYLPKTFSILESYARMERMGVEGGNIGAAMKDVEDIMDKLVLGFEKQLDALFDSEAMDVTTDVSVLENMMTMEGLSDLDPFGALAHRARNETWEKN